MSFQDVFFKRRFSVNLYRNLRLKMGEMSLYKDWTGCCNGDPYPVLSKAGEVTESVGGGCLRTEALQGGSVTRLLGSFFPWNTYSLRLSQLKSCRVGFFVHGEAGDIRILADGQGVGLICNEKEVRFDARCNEGAVLAVTFRTGGVSLYLDDALLGDVSLDTMQKYRRESVFSSATVALSVELDAGGACCLEQIEWYLCGGISHADIKPIRYEDGTPMLENGRVFFTVTSRTEENMYQSVLSWNPSTCDFRMEGALFFDCGDGIWASGVASSVLYDRNSKKWLLWTCAFSHTHVLGRAAFEGDPRFGVQVIDIRLMEPAVGDDLRDFSARIGDEDPDLLYRNGEWHLAVCRKEPDTGYHYYHYTSSDPLDGFTYVDRTPTGEKTGGMFVKTDADYVFVCGSDFHSRARYDVYPISDFSSCTPIKCNYDDGGFRGWGSVMLLPVGTKKRYVWITFDRHNASAFRWSYGNLYVFDSDFI